MSDQPAADDAVADDAVADDVPAERMFSTFGVASAVMGVLAVAAVVLGALIWSGHQRESGERAYQARVLQAAADWAELLANIDTDNVEATLTQLHDGTAGPLNTEFEAAVQPYRDVVRRLKAHSTGRVEAVALEAVHRDESGRSRPPGEQLPPELASRTDTVLVVATSVADNVGGEPQTVRWLLRLGVSDVAGDPMISALEFLR